MQKYTYFDKATGKRIYSETPLKDPGLQLVQTIRGGIPKGVEKRVKKPLTPEDELALYGPKV